MGGHDRSGLDSAISVDQVRYPLWLDVFRYNGSLATHV
jgi:hypothetical protein